MTVTLVYTDLNIGEGQNELYVIQETLYQSQLHRYKLLIVLLVVISLFQPLWREGERDEANIQSEYDEPSRMAH